MALIVASGQWEESLITSLGRLIVLLPMSRIVLNSFSGSGTYSHEQSHAAQCLE